LPLAFCLLPFAFQGALDDMGDEHEQRQTLNALITAIDEEPLSPRWRFGASGNKTRVFCLLPFTFCLLPFRLLLQSAMQNPKSCVCPVEDRRNNRRLPTVTCTL